MVRASDHPRQKRHLRSDDEERRRTEGAMPSKLIEFKCNTTPLICLVEIKLGEARNKLGSGFRFFTQILLFAFGGNYF